MIYLAYKGHSYVSRNALEKAINDYLDSIDRLAVIEKDFESLKAEIMEKIASLNKEFPRCKAVTAHFWSHDNDLTTNLSGDGVRCHFQLIAGKEDRLI